MQNADLVDTALRNLPHYINAGPERYSAMVCFDVLAAEIVRLRGEVELLRVGIERERLRAGIAPAEAKGDALDLGEPDELTPAMLRMVTPQPADGGAVAFYWRRDPTHGLQTIEVSDYESWGKDNRPEDAYMPAYTHPPAAQVQGEGRVSCLAGELPAKVSKPHGFPPMWADGWNDALTMVYETLGITDTLWEAYNARAPMPTPSNAGIDGPSALQHRGDSRGGEG